ncbi:MAG TPA: metal-dependent transcriptional regulator [Chloroflexota bacterium]
MNGKSRTIGRPGGSGHLPGEAAEDALKAIFKLQAVEKPVSTSAVASALGVSEPTATTMIKRLARLGLLHHEPYHGVILTPAGEQIALEVIRHHRLLETYLVRSLGVGWEDVHAEADRLEHAISEELEARIDALLGFPATDPHGDPIPTREGRLGSTPATTIADVAVGGRAIVRAVPDGDAALLRYLAELGLVPGCAVRVEEKAPFNGPLLLSIGERREMIGFELAASIRVETGIGPGEGGYSR